MKTSLSITTVFLLIIFLNACSPKVVKSTGDCNEPADVFTQNGFKTELANSTFGKVIVGEVKVSTNPQVIRLASIAAQDQKVLAYLRCLAINRDGYSQKEALYIEELAFFAARNPTAEQMQQFIDKNNPFKKKNRS